MTASATLSYPAGRVRSRYERFSAPWIALVHAPIPIVASLRHALALPRLAALCTFAASISGQVLLGKVS
jgi:hypothetical protein